MYTCIHTFMYTCIYVCMSQGQVIYLFYTQDRQKKKEKEGKRVHFMQIIWQKISLSVRSYWHDKTPPDTSDRETVSDYMVIYPAKTVRRKKGLQDDLEIGHTKIPSQKSVLLSHGLELSLSQEGYPTQELISLVFILYFTSLGTIET